MYVYTVAYANDGETGWKGGNVVSFRRGQNPKRAEDALSLRAIQPSTGDSICCFTHPTQFLISVRP